MVQGCRSQRRWWGETTPADASQEGQKGGPPSKHLAAHAAASPAPLSQEPPHLDLRAPGEGQVAVAVLRLPAVGAFRVADDGGFIEARVEVQPQLISALAKVNRKAAGWEQSRHWRIPPTEPDLLLQEAHPCPKDQLHPPLLLPISWQAEGSALPVLGRAGASGPGPSAIFPEGRSGLWLRHQPGTQESWAQLPALLQTPWLTTGKSL